MLPMAFLPISPPIARQPPQHRQHLGVVGLLLILKCLGENAQSLVARRYARSHPASHCRSSSAARSRSGSDVTERHPNRLIAAPFIPN
jgi:hypothetical protein